MVSISSTESYVKSKLTKEEIHKQYIETLFTGHVHTRVNDNNPLKL